MFRFLVTALSIICFLILCPVVVLAQAVPGIAPLEMTVSFLPQILLASSVTLAGLALIERRQALIAAPIVLIAALPFLTLSKFESPSGTDCPPDACLTVITANIYGRADSMRALIEIAEREKADLVGINEAVASIVEGAYAEAVPEYPHLVFASPDTLPAVRSRPIALLSREPFAASERIVPPDTAGRGLVVADLDGHWHGLRVVVAHAMTPMTQYQISGRNTLLRATHEPLKDQGTFILMGDFNLTPWSPTFRNLPGKRAGDPRLSNTWPTFFSRFGLSIDHVMFAGDLELVEFRVLETVGSDHYPVLARFKRKAEK